MKLEAMCAFQRESKSLLLNEKAFQLERLSVLDAPISPSDVHFAIAKPHQVSRIYG